ncbi:putative UDP-glycosyltransferase 76E1-like [Capsicum annuum]|nr:putative UDP-glycosyltransferase 76E1-like [Capsicum annuum]
MGAGRRTESYVFDTASSSTSQRKNTGAFRYLMKKQLGGVIFGCKNNTMKECIQKQLFGLPAAHFQYVKSIDPGLPLFLFNYSNRELHGIYEAASSGNMNINPYGWTSDGSGRTLYPAQVQMRPRQLCQPLPESLFKPIILNNYYNENHFLFELDHVQAGKLISEFSPRVLAPIRSMPQHAANRRNTIQDVVLKKTEEDCRPRHAECSNSGASLDDAKEENKQLINRYKMPVSSYPSHQLADETVFESINQVQLNPESIFLVGRYNGVSWFSTLESYSPSNDVLKSFKPMNLVRSYASVAKLGGELFVFGGGVGTGSLWYDTVESYSPADNKWTFRSPLNKRKGSLAGATLNDKIFAIGGGNQSGCLFEVELYDPQVARWITTRSMSQKRASLAAAELNGALYAVGGYDGRNYLATAERFDPREPYWTKISSMSTRRGCHACIVLDGQLNAIGGYDGTTMVCSTEIYDPRFPVWMVGQPMKHARGYLAAAVLQESIYVIGGVQSNKEFVDVIECYKDGQGWQTPNLTGIERRCCCAAIVLTDH